MHKKDSYHGRKNMYRSKLKKLYRFIKNHVEDDWFDLHDWVSHLENFQKHKCGTTACLFGWAVEAFPDQLRWATKSELRNIGHYIVNKKNPYPEMCEMGVAMEMFDLSSSQADFLFASSFYPDCYYTSRKEALKRLKWLFEKADDNFHVTRSMALRGIIPEPQSAIKRVG